MKNERWHAFFSFEAYKEGCGTCFYFNEIGVKVEVTAVYENLEQAKRYGYQDKEYRGIVYGFAGLGRQSEIEKFPIFEDIKERSND